MVPPDPCGRDTSFRVILAHTRKNRCSSVTRTGQRSQHHRRGAGRGPRPRFTDSGASFQRPLRFSTKPSSCVGFSSTRARLFLSFSFTERTQAALSSPVSDPLVLTLNTAAAALDTVHRLSSMSSGIGIADAAARAIGGILSSLLSSLRHAGAPPHVFALCRKRSRKFSAAESSRHNPPFKKRSTYW